MNREFSPTALGRRKAVIFDVDGTLCDVRSVRRYVEAPPGSKKFKPNYDLFHSTSIDCPPYSAVKRIAVRARELGLSIIVVTGRVAKWRGLTEDWLNRNSIPWDALYTRGHNDYRPDHVIKSEINEELQIRFKPLVAIDDRDDILHVWKTAGIVTVKVSQSGQLSNVSEALDVEVSGYIEALGIGQDS